MVVDVSKFARLEDFRKQVSEAVELVKDTPPMQGFDGVLYPGEIENRNRRERKAKGVFVEDATWKDIVACIDRFDLRDRLLQT